VLGDKRVRNLSKSCKGQTAVSRSNVEWLTRILAPGVKLLVALASPNIKSKNL